jgi:hypothetical protein
VCVCVRVGSFVARRRAPVRVHAVAGCDSRSLPLLPPLPSQATAAW